MLRFTTLAILFPLTAFAQEGLDENGDPIPLTTYTVTGDALVGAASEDDLFQWERFNEVIPLKYHSEIVTYQPIDGQYGIDGTVAPASDDRTTWVLMLDTTGDTEQSELERTMIHEFAHLLTLRLDQLPAGSEEGICDTYYISDGCMYAESYLAVFGDIFWDGENGEEEGTAEERFRPEDYVTEYAATNSVEDIAESFAEFIVNPDKWQGETIADQKVQFFEEYQELVTLRDEVRAGLN